MGPRQRLDARHQVAPGPVLTPSSEDALIARDIVYTALGHLDPRRRAVIVLFELEGKAIVEIARLLGITAVTRAMHLSRGRRELATQIENMNRGKS